MRLLIIGLILSAACTFSACKKEEDHTATPAIQILKPQSNAFYEAGDTIDIEVQITHNAELHNYQVKATHPESGAQSIIREGHQHKKAINISTPFVLWPEKQGVVWIVVSVSDHQNGISRDSVQIQIQ